MTCLDLHLDCPGLNITDVAIEPDTVTVHVESSDSTATCPDCGRESNRVHSRYTRRITDLCSATLRSPLRVASSRNVTEGWACFFRVCVFSHPRLLLLFTVMELRLCKGRATTTAT